MLAAVITAKTSREISKDIKKADNADLIELRTDYIKNPDYKKLEKIIKKCKKPLIITCRKKNGAGFYGSGRIFLADYIDIECSAGNIPIINKIKTYISDGKINTKLIVSYHNFKGTPDNIKEIYHKIKILNPDIIKIATNANSIADNFKIFDLIKLANKEGKKLTAFCMGPYGQFSRVLSVIIGSQITYASLGIGKESAGGQLTLNEMNNIYRVKKLNMNTGIFGLIGDPVEHSWSHIMHNAAFDRLNINAVYLKFKVDRLKEFINYSKRLNAGGFSVTIPYKIKIMEYLDKIDKKAIEIGAVNTITAKNKQLIGHNTDCDGAIEALKSKIALKNKNAAILGAGGSSRAIAYGLIKDGAKVTILNRTIKNAKIIAEGYDCNYGSLNDLGNIDYDILINTTPVGMHPNINSSPVPLRFIKKKAVVFDIVFNPYYTKLLKDAEKKGCITIPGLEMLVNGAAMQFRLWTGRNPPKQLMRGKIEEYLKNDSNKY